MGLSNSSSRGGFLRGTLAGLIVIFFLFCGLAAVFPISKSINLSNAPEVSVSVANVQPEVSSENSFGAISIPSDSPTPSGFGSNPVPFQVSESDVTIAPAQSAPVNAVSNLQAMPTNNDISVGAAESSPPVIELPEVPVVDVPSISSSPVVEDTSQAPVVVASTTPVATQPTLDDASAANDDGVTQQTESLEKPSGGFSLSGQTIIQPTVSEASSGIENTSSTTSFASFRQDFENSSDLSMLSFVILADTPDHVTMLSELPVPVTMAVSGDNPDAANLVMQFRETGGEVVVMLSGNDQTILSNGGEPSGVSGAISSVLANSNGVIGVFDGPEGSVNQDQRMLSAILGELSKTGHALFTVNGLGLNRAEIMAKEAGLPGTSIDKAFEAHEGKVSVIRGLDKVILQMGDVNGVTVYAPASSDLVSALKFWLKSQKAKLVTVAPLSAQAS